MCKLLDRRYVTNFLAARADELNRADHCHASRCAKRSTSSEKVSTMHHDVRSYLPTHVITHVTVAKNKQECSEKNRRTMTRQKIRVLFLITITTIGFCSIPGRAKKSSAFCFSSRQRLYKETWQTAFNYFIVQPRRTKISENVSFLLWGQCNVSIFCISSKLVVSRVCFPENNRLFSFCDSFEEQCGKTFFILASLCD